MYFALKLGQTGFEDEFNRLSLIRTNCSFQEAKKVCNKMKNRYEVLYSCDDTRVKLQENPGVLGSDYINANYVDSYQFRNSFIATQAPIECTIKDFWKMVWEQNSKTIVVLCKEYEKGEVKSNAVIQMCSIKRWFEKFTCFFVCILQNFSKIVSCRTPPDDCFCKVYFEVSLK